jgi:anti-sigma-K factor RskA
VTASPDRIERAEELAALCAIGAATASERAELESMAADDPAVRAIVRGFADAASLVPLELAPIAPPPGVLDAVRRRLVPGGADDGGVAPPFGRRPGPGADIVSLASRRRRPAIVLAIVLPLAAAAVLAVFWAREREERLGLVEREAALRTELDNERRVRTRAVAEAARVERRVAELEGTLQKVSTPELRLTTLKSEQGVTMKILLDPLTGNWYVLAFDLPVVASDKDYQLWFLDKKQGGKPIPSSVLTPGPSSSLHTLIQVPEGVEPGGAAISLEPKGGSPSGAPTQVVMGGPLL